ncbi:hypothetical protein PC39_03817 [Salinisphaera sp. PC39]|uniref:tellurite resistance TerB family protein n=1 Tax=Salinisphaera sp. PC39 TaxID=1304156 RepID=UPI003342C540
MNLLEKLRNSLGGDSAADEDPEHRLQLAAAVLLLEMEHADHVYETTERAEIERQLKAHFNLDDDEVVALLAAAEPEARESVSLHGFLRALNDGLSMPEKRRVLEMLWRVAYADERLDPQEEHLLRHLSELLHMPHSEFIKAKLAVQGDG